MLIVLRRLLVSRLLVLLLVRFFLIVGLRPVWRGRRAAQRAGTAADQRADRRTPTTASQAADRSACPCAQQATADRTRATFVGVLERLVGRM